MSLPTFTVGQPTMDASYGLPPDYTRPESSKTTLGYKPIFNFNLSNLITEQWQDDLYAMTGAGPTSLNLNPVTFSFDTPKPAPQVEKGIPKGLILAGVALGLVVAFLPRK